MEPFNLNVIKDVESLWGRKRVISALMDCAERRENAGIIGSRRFGKTSVLKSMEIFLAKSKTKAYPLYFEAKHEGIVKNTDNVYSRITAILASKMCKDGLLEEKEYKIGRNTNVYFSNDKIDIYDQLVKFGSERQRESLLTMSKVLAKRGHYLLLLFDEIEYLFLNSLSKPSDFSRIRTWASTGEPIKFWIAGTASWDDITTGVGSSEFNGGLDKIALEPFEYEDFSLLWYQECNLIEDVEKKEALLNLAREVYEASGGIPFYVKKIGKELLRMDKPIKLPPYTILREYFVEVMDNQFLKENERRFLISLADSPIVFDEIVPDEVIKLKEKGLVVEKDNSYIIPIKFLCDYILSTTIELKDDSRNSKLSDEIPIIADEILRLRDNINKVWSKHELWRTLRTDSRWYPPFEASTEDYKEIDALREVSNNPNKYGAFAGALHRLYYEGSNKGKNLPQGFGPWERPWFVGEDVSAFAMMVNVNRHMFQHREFEPDEHVAMTDEDFLKIVNGGKRPESNDDYVVMQYNLLLECRKEMQRMMSFLMEEAGL